MFLKHCAALTTILNHFLKKQNPLLHKIKSLNRSGSKILCPSKMPQSVRSSVRDARFLTDSRVAGTFLHYGTSVLVNMLCYDVCPVCWSSCAVWKRVSPRLTIKKFDRIYCHTSSHLHVSGSKLGLGSRCKTK